MPVARNIWTASWAGYIEDHFAELLLSEVEADTAFSTLTVGNPAHRLLDDFLVGFPNYAIAEQALGALRAALWKFNLQLNETKTTVAPTKTHVRDRWKLDFDAMSFSHTDAQAQAKDLTRLVEITLHHCLESRTTTPAVWACRRLAGTTPLPENFDLFLDALFRLSRDFPPSLHYVAAFM